MIHPVGTRVRINEDVKGRYAGREGVILLDNTSCGAAEYGIAFGRTARVDAWFIESELEIHKPLIKLKVFLKESDRSL
jgi:hypothetical protein